MKITISELFPELSPRQRQVCALVIQGLPSKEIAYRLGIGYRTVEDHRSAVLVRVGARSVRELTFRAFGSPEVIA
jgi:two-component system response regulator FixJ